jgi:hypothetical protein
MLYKNIPAPTPTPVSLVASLVDTLGGRHGLALVLVQRKLVVVPVRDGGGALLGVEVGQRVLHPVLVVALLEVLSGVGACRGCTGQTSYVRSRDKNKVMEVNTRSKNARVSLWDGSTRDFERRATQNRNTAHTARYQSSTS